MIKTKLDRVCSRCLKRSRMKNKKYCYTCETNEERYNRLHPKIEKDYIE